MAVVEDLKSIVVKTTWVKVLPWILTVLENGNDKGKLMAREELKRMAIAADMAVAARDAANNKPET